MSATSPRDVREVLRQKMATALSQGAPAPSEGEASGPGEAAMEAAKRVEAAVAGKFGAASKEYTAKGRSLIFNLQKNAQLRAQLVAGVLSVDWLVTASTADLATDALKLQRRESTDRYYAQRSLGASDEKMTGWNAGTTGKLEWSHKYEKEKAASSSATTPAGAAMPDDDDDRAAASIGGEDGEDNGTHGYGGGDDGEAATAHPNKEEDAEVEEDAPIEYDEGEDLESLAEGAGLEDVEADLLKDAESTADDEEDDEDDEDGYIPEPVVRRPAGPAAAGSHNAKQPFEPAASGQKRKQPETSAFADFDPGDYSPTEEEPEPQADPQAEDRYTRALVRGCDLAGTIAGARADLGPTESTAEKRVAAAVARSREVLQAWLL